MIFLSNSRILKHVIASGAMGFDGCGWFYCDVEDGFCASPCRRAWNCWGDKRFECFVAS